LTVEIFGDGLYLKVGAIVALVRRSTLSLVEVTHENETRDFRFEQREGVSLAELFMQAPTPLLILTGPEHRFTSVNPPYIRLMRRLSEESVIGKTIREGLPELEGQGIFELLDHVYQTGVAYEGNEAPVTLYREDTGAPDHGYFNFVYQPIRGGEGKVEGIMVHATDVTELVRARMESEGREQLLRRQWSELEAIYRTAPIGLALLSAQSFEYLRVNEVQCAMIGRPAEEILGKTVRDVAPKMAERLEALFRQVVAGTPVREMEIEGEYPAQPGVHRCWIVSFSPIYSEDGQVDAITCVTLEVTAQRRLDAALIQSEKLAAVGRLASSIAHEINNPLESVVNLIYLARLKAIEPDIQSFLDLADQELRRVANIVNQTLRFHKQASRPRAISCLALFSTLLNMYEGRLKNSNIGVEKRKRATEPVVCFEGDIRQVLNNVVGNAIDAMPGGGRLFVRSRKGTDWRSGRVGLVLTVADDGSGIDAQTQLRMFDAFFTTKGIGGSGLGLWISAEIMERHQGRIRIRSSQRDGSRGTVVALFLPFQTTQPMDGCHP
jgi:PAS domain S-box-containing protein